MKDFQVLSTTEVLRGQDLMTKRQNFSKVAGTADGCQLSQLIYLNMSQCWFRVLKKILFSFRFFYFLC